MLFDKNYLEHLDLQIKLHNKKQTVRNLNLRNYKSLGFSTYFSLVKKISGRFLGFSFLRRSFLGKILKKFRKHPKFIHFDKMKKISLKKTKKRGGRKYARIKARLPLRGQRTHTNASTVRGKKKKKF